MDRIKVVIIDEQQFFRAGVRQALSQQSDFEILDGPSNEDIMGLIEANLPNVALLGASLSTPSELELARRISRNYPNTRVIVLSPEPNDEELFEVIKTAAVACLSKSAAAEELAGTITQSYNG